MMKVDSKGTDTSMKVSPRKALGMSKSAGNFGVGQPVSPNANSGKMMNPEMADNSRGIGSPMGSKGGMPSQAAPDHGPHDPGSMEKGWRRGAMA